jgi:hypothetical protein
MTIPPLAAIASMRTQPEARADSALTMANSLLFETFLKSANVGKALVPASLEGGIYSDFLLQQLALDLARQMGNPALVHGDPKATP